MLTPREIAKQTPFDVGYNHIINGDMHISQRGDFSVASPGSSGIYHLDRFTSHIVAVSADIQHMSVDQPENDTKTRSLRWTATTADAAGIIGMYQRIEGYEGLIGKDVAVSAWVKSNSPKARLLYNDETWSGLDVPHSGNGQWEKLYGTVKVRDTSHQAVLGAYLREANGDPVNINIGDYVEATEFKVELGTQPTPFEARPKAEELALCQRYYIKMPVSGVVTGLTDSAMAGREFPVEMRATPTVTNPCLNSNYVSSAPSTGQWSLQKVGVNSAIKGGTITRSSVPTINAANLVWWGGAWSTVSDYLNGPGLYLEADAEM